MMIKKTLKFHDELFADLISEDYQFIAVKGIDIWGSAHPIKHNDEYVLHTNIIEIVERCLEPRGYSPHLIKALDIDEKEQVKASLQALQQAVEKYYPECIEEYNEALRLMFLM